MPPLRYTIVIQTAAVESAYPLSAKLKDKVIGDDYEEILTVDDMWEYLEGDFIDATFVDEGDDGSVEEVPAGRWGYVLEVNRIVGAIQFRQNRVDVGGVWNSTPSCDVPEVFKQEIDKCYPSLETGYSSDVFGGSCGCDVTFDAPPCATSPCDDSFHVTEGLLHDEDPVFLYDLPTNITAAAARARLANLKERGWIDLQSRSFRIYLTVYNPAVDLFSSVELDMELTQHGGVDVSYGLKTVNLVRHMLLLTDAREKFPPSNSDYGILFVELLFYSIAFILWFQTMQLMWNDVWGFFQSGWNVMDFINYNFFMAVIVLRLYILKLLNDVAFDPPPNVYSDFYQTARFIYTVANIISVTCILSYLKLLRFLQLSARLSTLTNTISAASSDIGHFLVIFFVVFLAYAQAFFMAFGMDLEGFGTLGDSIATLLLIILGEFDYDAIAGANSLLGPPLFFSFVVFVFFILVNMFIAILGEAHEEVTSQVPEDDPFVSKMRAGWRRRLRALRRQRYVGHSKGVQDLARTIATEEDVPLPEEDEQGDGAFALDEHTVDPDAPPRLAISRAASSEDGKDGKDGDEAGGTVFGIKRASLLNRGRSTLGLMSLGQVMNAAQQADAATLLKALNEEVADANDDEGAADDADGEGGAAGEAPDGMAAGGGSGRAEGRGVRFGGGRMPGGRVVGLPRDLAKELTERVEVMEKENLQLAEWLQKNHRATQEKINLLTEATFAITNMLAGVQGVDAMQLLEATDHTVTQEDDPSRTARALDSPMSSMEAATSRLRATQSDKGRAKRAMIIAGAKSGRDAGDRKAALSQQDSGD